MPLRISGGPASQTDLSPIRLIRLLGTPQIDKFGTFSIHIQSAMKNSTISPLAFSDVLLPSVLTLSSLGSRFIEVDIFILRGILY